MVSVPLVACTSRGPAPGIKAEAPARIEAIDGSDVKRVIVTDKAAERLGLKTTPVVEQQVGRMRTVGAEVVVMDSGDTVVRVHATPNDVRRVDQLAHVAPLGPRHGAAPASLVLGPTAVAARAIEPPAALVKDDPSLALFYSIDNRDASLTNGQRVLLEFPLAGGSPQRKLMPYSAVLYDVRGETWSYVRTAPLTFVRQRVSLDYIDGETAVLLEGPAAGSEVVTTGATELFGTEFKVGK
jgi:hypothetical protein